MLRVRTVFTSAIAGSPYLSTMYFTGDDDASGALDAVTAVGAFWGAVDALMDSEVTWATEDEVVVMSNDGTITGSHSITPVTGAGALAAEALPLASQALVRWVTGQYVNGRRLRGRTFIPGLVEASNNNGRLVAASSTVIQNAANVLVAVATVDLAVWSKTHSVSFPVSSASVWSEFAILRSRRD